MLKSLALSAMLTSAAFGANAQPPADQLQHLVSLELSDYVADVDATDLSRHQLATIYQIMHSGGSHGKKSAMIQSVLGGRFSLRGLLFN